jgi:type IV pilus assembly protein PilE
MSHRLTNGFTLIEMLITASVAAILAGVAVPAYQDQIRKSRRSDAVQAITSVQLAEEKYRATNTTYASSLTTLGFASSPLPSTGGYYSVAISGTSATAYVVTATSVSGTSQASDTGCTSIVLAVASTTISQTPAKCWNR